MSFKRAPWINDWYIQIPVKGLSFWIPHFLFLQRLHIYLGFVNKNTIHHTFPIRIDKYVQFEGNRRDVME